jgi:hypothetical protein
MNNTSKFSRENEKSEKNTKHCKVTTLYVECKKIKKNTDLTG